MDVIRLAVLGAVVYVVWQATSTTAPPPLENPQQRDLNYDPVRRCWVGFDGRCLP